MLYILDANVLIDANRDYYALARVPEFWDWLEYQGTAGAIKIPLEVHEEVKDGNDDLGADPALVARVTSAGYAADLTDDEVIRIGRDPFLISYALIDLPNRTVVTMEGSRPSRRRANRHIPDVCQALGVACVNTFELVRHLNFTTNWRRP
jgi:hypothetical protein